MHLIMLMPIDILPTMRYTEFSKSKTKTYINNPKHITLFVTLKVTRAVSQAKG